jgi:CRP/FNR family cyclic AMP-dependent transcriptional regulator
MRERQEWMNDWNEASGVVSMERAVAEYLGVAYVSKAEAHTLARTILFAGLISECVRSFDSRCIWSGMKSGGWVIDPTTYGSEVHFVIRGHAQIVIASSGREIILGDLNDGDFTGELSAIDGKSRSNGIRAVTDVLVARMSAAVFR